MSVRSWTKQDVSVWLKSNDTLCNLSDLFLKEDINGQALLDLTMEDMKDELGLSLGQRKLLIKLIDELKSGQSSKESNEDKKLFVLTKGLLAEGNPLSLELQEKIRNNRFFI